MEVLAEPPVQGQHEHLFDGPIRLIAVGVLPPPVRLADHDPVGRSIAGAAKPLRIDESLQQMNRVRIDLLPVARHPPRHLSEDVRSQMRYPHPRQNQEPRVVGDQMNVAPPRPLVPANEPVAAAQMPWRTRPRQARNRLAARFDQILQVLTYRLFVFQVVILLHQAVEQRLLPAAPHLYDLQWRNLLQRAFYRPVIRHDRFRAVTTGQRIRWTEARRW